MAAPVFQSVQTSGWQTTNAVVTKPTGLAVGDLMIGHFISSAAGAQTLPSGFTSLDSRNDTAGDQTISISYKFAVSGDVSASNFTFSGTADVFASITRVTGNGATTATLKSGGASAGNTATPSVSAGVTPTNHSTSNLLLQFWGANVGVTSVASYACATSNPTWTEGYDTASSGRCGAMAYATRPEFTATGNISCAGGTASTDWVGQLVAVAEDWSVSVAESVTLTDGTSSSPSQIVADSITLTEAVNTDKSTAWINEPKSSDPLWVNQNKS